MADPTSSTKSLSDSNNARNTPSNVSIHSKSPLDTNGTAQPSSTIAPFEIESTNVNDIEYPTGVKFMLVLMAAGLSLILVGLVRNPSPSRSDNIETDDCIMRLGLQYHSHGRTSHIHALQNHYRCGMVLLCLVSCMNPRNHLPSIVS